MSTATFFNIQHFSVHDGPGIRTTVFLKGCPLRCAWCHNPESGDVRPQLAFRADRCLVCGACEAVCPEGIAAPVDPGTAANHDLVLCRRCGECAAACPTGARELVGQSATVDEVLEEVLADRGFYRTSGGGVTLSGGEPLSVENAPFTLDFLNGCLDNDLHAAVDTCGHVDRDVLLAAAERADLILFDLKTMDPERHRKATGLDNARILDNLRALSATDAEVWLRVPLIPGLTDDVKNLQAVAEFAAGLPRRHPLHLLPYHAIAREKYDRLGMPYALADTKTPPDAAVNQAADRLREHGLSVHIGG